MNANPSSAAYDHEGDAKIAYSIWADAFHGQPWEQIPERERRVWREILEFMLTDSDRDEPDCEECGGPLICRSCEGKRNAEIRREKERRKRGQEAVPAGTT